MFGAHNVNLQGRASAGLDLCRLDWLLGGRVSAHGGCRGPCGCRRSLPVSAGQPPSAAPSVRRLRLSIRIMAGAASFAERLPDARPFQPTDAFLEAFRDDL